MWKGRGDYWAGAQVKDTGSGELDEFLEIKTALSQCISCQFVFRWIIL